MTERLFALVGPTASGKTSITLGLAPEFGAEIVAVDSMTIYRGMDIGTAKPTADERARVRHHMLDVAEPLERFTVARFQGEARAAIADIRARGARPLVVGGSGLYFRAVVDDLEFPPTDEAVRARLEAQDHDALRARLKELDPEAAAFIDPANVRRVVRALEVVEITGRPFSSFRAAWERFADDVVVAGLEVDDAELDRRIRARLEGQLEAGLLDEVRALDDAGFRAAVTAAQAIPYAHALALADGSITRDEFLLEAARATRRLARRQLSWFRRDPRVRWFDADDVERATEGIRAYWSQEGTR